MKSKRRSYFYIVAGILLSSVLLILCILIVNMLREQEARKPITEGMSVASAPFLHRPYYGSQTILQRTVSFVDHDKPWYVEDNLFVRFDGKRWANTNVNKCDGGISCYDGHNGYDLNLRFEPVLSAAAGTVTRAGWYNPLDHSDAFGLWVAIDHGNGYVTAYGHMSAVAVSVGDKVGSQWQIGTSGTTGSSSGPHLHMSTYYLPNWQAMDPFGWTGNYADPNVVPDHYLWVDHPSTSGTAPNLSGSAVYPGATLVNDGGSGWSSTGNWARETAKSDIQGDMHWTRTTAGAPSASATWRPTLPGDGYYEVGVYVDDNHASSSWAPYTVYSADPARNGVEVRHTVYLDQSHIGLFPSPFGTINTGPQWISLGSYYFRKAMNGRVVLNNATGGNGAMLGADGVEFAPMSQQATKQDAATAYSFTVSRTSTPALLLPGTTVHVNVEVKNVGKSRWQAAGAAPLAFGYHWQDSSGHELQPERAVSSTTPLRADVAAGGAATIPLSLQTPVVAGKYTLVYGLQNQGKWVSSPGTGRSAMAVTITPNVPRTYYFAEGYTGQGTTENLALTNLAAGQATIHITYLYTDAAPQTRTYLLAALAHEVLNINSEAGANRSVSMIVQGDQTFVAERTMYTQKDSLVAATDSLGAATLSKTWYFAEGNTTFGWNTLLSALNPGDSPVTLTVQYLPTKQPDSTSGRIVKSYSMPARARFTLVLNNEMPNQQFGMAITASGSVAIERAEYLVKSPRRGGSAVVGATSLRKAWYFGAGNTSPGFTETLVLTNPAQEAANAHIEYQTSDGQRFTQNVVVPGQSRSEVSVNAVVKQADHATMISASIPIVAERQDFFSSNIEGSTTVMASSSPRTDWYLAQSDTTAGHATSLSLANFDDTSAQVQIVYYQADRQPIVKRYTLDARTLLEVAVARDGVANETIGVAIYATSPILVEQTTYFNLQGASGSYAGKAYWT